MLLQSNAEDIWNLQIAKFNKTQFQLNSVKYGLCDVGASTADIANDERVR
jgi:hypothetical protein